jgi:hypothetical protein
LLDDFEWTRQLLIQDKQHDRLHEFLKARLYGLGACLEGEHLARLQRRQVDYGPVDETMLGDMAPEPPHGDAPNDLYRTFMARIGQK